MKVLVLGGCGIQGRTAVNDLASSSDVKEVICADISLNDLDLIKDFTDMNKVTPHKIDASNLQELRTLFSLVDVIVDMLPRGFKEVIFQAAFETGTSVVNTNYLHDMPDFDQKAKAANITIMPECGLDPGIDLVTYRYAGNIFDEIHVINSYCGGFPEKSACTNLINYKKSWIWEGVLSSTNRKGKIIKNGNVINIPGADQHEKKYLQQIEFPGLGELEAIPNGDAVFFTDILKTTATIKETGRYSLRWPGWSDFWRPLKQFGFLSDKPVAGLPGDISPIKFLDKLMGPQLDYHENEKDLVAMLNVFEGIKDGQKVRLSCSMLIERDLETGLMAMSKGVAYPASIVAQMIGSGEISEKGLLSPLKHIPCDLFFKRLKERGIEILETEEKVN